MKEVILEKSKCIGCGVCHGICPKYFEIKEDNKSHIKGADYDLEKEEEKLEINDIDCVKEAVGSCPAQCIHIK